MARQSGPIAVYGATGYTGRLIAAELAAAGADFVLSGRNEAKLAALAEQVGSGARTQVASLDDPASLRALLEGCAAVISAAGPFILIGDAILRAAIETQTHYLDTSGEQRWVDRVFRRHGADAERSEIAAVSAMGFDYVPGDMIASLTAAGMDDIEDVLVANAWLDFEPTRGTALSSIEILKGGGVEYREGAWRPAARGISAGHFDFPEPIGRRRMARIPSGEQVTVPRHVRTRNVRTMLTAETVSAHPALAPLLPALAPPLRLALQTPVKRVVSAAVGRLPEGPSEKVRRKSNYTIVCDVTGGGRTRRGVITGIDAYGLTAKSIANGAVIAASKGFDPIGALAPSQAFDPSRFLASLDGFELEWDVEDPRPLEALPA